MGNEGIPRCPECAVDNIYTCNSEWKNITRIIPKICCPLNSSNSLSLSISNILLLLPSTILFFLSSISSPLFLEIHSYRFRRYHWYQSSILAMTEGVSTRLQKDMEKMESKLDGMTEQLRADIRLEVMKGIEVLRLELIKHGQNAEVTTGEVTSDKQGSTVVELPSPVNNQKSIAGSSRAEMISNLEKSHLVLRVEA